MWFCTCACDFLLFTSQLKYVQCNFQFFLFLNWALKSSAVNITLNWALSNLKLRLSILPNQIIKLLKQYSGRGCCECSEPLKENEDKPYWVICSVIENIKLLLGKLNCSWSISYQQECKFFSSQFGCLGFLQSEVWARIHL